MKNYVILTIFLFLCLSKTAQGQTTDEMYKNPDIMRKLIITVPIQNHFGDEHIERIGFAIDSDTIASVYIDPKHDTAYIKKTFLASGAFSQRFFFFDFGFEGDRLVFKKKYPQIQSPTLPSAKITNMYEKEDSSRTYTIGGVRLYADSTVYVYTHGYKPDYTKSHFGMPAKYVGDLQEVEEQIAREMASAAVGTLLDSTLVYGAVITRYPVEEGMAAREKFELENLLYGKPSAFSKIVEKTLLAKETNFDENGQPKWDFAIMPTSGRPMDTRIKIYVHLNTDGSITIKLPRMLGNFTGD